MLSSLLKWYHRRKTVLAWIGIAGLLAVNLVLGVRSLKAGLAGFLNPLSFPAQVEAPSDQAQAFVQIVSDYNQATIQANDTGNLALLQPYLHTAGPAYRNLVDVYRQRAERNEAHQVELARPIGVGPVEISEGVVVVSTQEEWNDRCYNFETGETIYIYRGQVVRHEYELHQLGGEWKIWDIRATLIRASD